MPGLDYGSVAAGVPYSWEAAPGKPISGAVSESTEPRAPLPPPPGMRKPLTFVVEPVFVGFEPEPQELLQSSGPHFAEKLFKKLQRKLRKKSKALAASFSAENLRTLSEHKKRTSEGAASASYDADERQPDTPCSAESVSKSSMSSMSSLSNASTSWESFGHNSALHQDGSQRSIDMILAMSASEFQDDGAEGCLSGPRESAWHEDSEEEELTEQEWQIVRYASLEADNPSLISSLVRQSSLTPLSKHSYRLSPVKGRGGAGVAS